MISITEEALTYIEGKKQSLFIDIPHTVTGCCFDITDCPSVNFGKPEKLMEYTQETIQGITVFVPARFPRDNSIAIKVRRFFGFKKLVITGWRLI